MQHSIISYSCHAVHYIPMTYFTAGNLNILTHFAHPLPAIPTSGNHQSVLYIHVLGFLVLFVFRFYVSVRSYGIYLFLSDLFHFAECPQDTSMFPQIILLSFLHSIYYYVTGYKNGSSIEGPKYHILLHETKSTCKFSKDFTKSS